MRAVPEAFSPLRLQTGALLGVPQAAEEPLSIHGLSVEGIRAPSLSPASAALRAGTSGESCRRNGGSTPHSSLCLLRAWKEWPAGTHQIWDYISQILENNGCVHGKYDNEGFPRNVEVSDDYQVKFEPENLILRYFEWDEILVSTFLYRLMSKQWYKLIFFYS